jgi:hypothetical protein
MSKRSIFLRSEADKCLILAWAISDAETKVQLRKLATEYVVRAAEIEGTETERKGKAASVGGLFR